MNGGQFIAVLALMIPIIAIVTKNLRRWRELDIEAAEVEADLRRQFRAFDLIERRVADIETYVTSPEYRLNRELGALADKPKGDVP